MIKKVKDLRKIFPVMISALAMIMLCGCKVETVNFREEVFKVNIGAELSDAPGDYVRASKMVLADMTVDLSAVNTDVIGTYTAVLRVKDEERKFKIEVADLEAPQITLKKDCF